MRLVYPNSRERIRSVVSDCVKFVAKSYGPAGEKVLIQDEHRIRSVDDGKIILENYELENESDNAVIKYIKEATAKTDSRVGDGTTTSAILMGAIVEEVLGKNKNVLAVQNPHGYLEEVRRGAIEAVNLIRKSAKPVKDKKELYEVALNASNSEEIATLISETLFAIGKDGVISIQDSHTERTIVETKDGLELEKGYASPYLINKDTKVVMDNPHVLLVNKKLDSFKEMIPLLTTIKGEQIFIIADGFSEEVIMNMVVGRSQGLIKPLLVENPAYGDQKIELLKDLEAITGAYILEPKIGFKIEELRRENLGSLDSVIAEKNTTTLLGGKKPTARIKELKDQLSLSTTDYEKDKLVRRIAALSGGVSVIKVGANTTNEQETKRLKVEDAINATRHAYRTGIVRGAGKTLSSIETSSEILNKALKAPRSKLEENGKEFLDDKVFDPADVVIAALESAVSIGCGLIEMSGIIYTKREKKQNPEY